jgi:hypothetical protein
MTINNLYVTYDDGGNAHYFINDSEVPIDEWTQHHPQLRRDTSNVRNAGRDVAATREAIRRGRAEAEGNRIGGAPAELG